MLGFALGIQCRSYYRKQHYSSYCQCCSSYLIFSVNNAYSGADISIITYLPTIQTFNSSTTSITSLYVALSSVLISAVSERLSPLASIAKRLNVLSAICLLFTLPSSLAISSCA